MAQQRRWFSGDSYIVDITPPGTSFPWVKVVRRKKIRLWGRIAGDEEIRAPGFGNMDVFDEPTIDDTARQIGRAILDDSEIIRDYRARRQQRECRARQIWRARDLTFRYRMRRGAGVA